MRAVCTATAVTLVAALVMWLAACERDRPTPQPPPEPPPLGATPTPAGAELPRSLTIREVCHQVGAANCARAAACTGIDAAECTRVIMEQCCPDAARCETDSGYTAAAVDRCVQAFDDLHCRAIESHKPPTACSGIMLP